MIKCIKDIHFIIWCQCRVLSFRARFKSLGTSQISQKILTWNKNINAVNSRRITLYLIVISNYKFISKYKICFNVCEITDIVFVFLNKNGTCVDRCSNAWSHFLIHKKVYYISGWKWHILKVLYSEYNFIFHIIYKKNLIL